MKNKVIKRIRVDLAPYLTELLADVPKPRQLGVSWLFEVMVSATLGRLCDALSDYNLGGNHYLDSVFLEVEDTMSYEYMIIKHTRHQPLLVTDTELVSYYFYPVAKLLQRLMDSEPNPFSNQYQLSGVTNGIFHITVSR